MACAIVAGNRWDGYLSVSATGPPIENTELLLGSDYYFIVPPPSQGESFRQQIPRKCHAKKHADTALN